MMPPVSLSPVLFPAWVTSTKPYWVTLAKHRRRVRPHGFGKPHLAKDGEAGDIMTYARSRPVAQPGLHRITRKGEMLRLQVRAELLGILQKPAVDRREPLLCDFTTLRLGPVKFCAIPELARTQVRGDTRIPCFTYSRLKRRVSPVSLTPRIATWTWGCSVLWCSVATHSSSVPRSFSISVIRSRVSRDRSTRSPNSGETISFQIC